MGLQITLVFALLAFDLRHLGSVAFQSKFVFALLSCCLRHFGIMLCFCVIEAGHAVCVHFVDRLRVDDAFLDHGAILYRLIDSFSAGFGTCLRIRLSIRLGNDPGTAICARLSHARVDIDSFVAQHLHHIADPGIRRRNACRSWGNCG